MDGHPPRHDHIAFTAYEPEKSIVTAMHQIARSKPVPSHDLRCRFRAVDIAGHHDRAADLQFADIAIRYRAIRFVDNDGHSDYFTPEGRSVRKAFVRAPVDFTRISSSFNPRRRHPVLNTIRAHRGVDYAAPRGTPIKAAGDGKVIFRGRKGGYGNAVIVQHGGNITTLYAHMSNFARKSRLGSRVKQGQIIGYVGSTGLATAAHLHYEYRLNGVHRNPRTVQLPQAEPISDKYREKFLAQAEPLLKELIQYKRMQIADATTD